jgi:ammonia channel protein AmtB
MNCIKTVEKSQKKILGMTTLAVGQLSFFFAMLIDKYKPDSYQFEKGILIGLAGVTILAAIVILIYYYVEKNRNL